MVSARPSSPAAAAARGLQGAASVSVVDALSKDAVNRVLRGELVSTLPK
jgi:hypothetical protein